MAPFVIVAIVAASLFGSGVIIKPQEPVLGTTLEAAGVGTLVGGAVGAAVGGTVVAGGTAVGAIGADAVIGGVAGGAAGTIAVNHGVKINPLEK